MASAQPPDFGPLPEEPVCAYCGALVPSPVRCGLCKLMHYCHDEHRAAHLRDHGLHCSNLASAFHQVLEADTQAAQHPYHRRSPQRSIAARWRAIDGLRDVRPQTRIIALARLEYLKQTAGRLEAGWIKEGWQWAPMPGLLLRLWQDQVAYNVLTHHYFVEYGPAPVNQKELVQHGNTNALKRFNPRVLMRDTLSTQHLVLLVLLKVKLLLDLQRMNAVGEVLSAHLPNELVSRIRHFTAWSPIVLANTFLSDCSPQELGEYIWDLQIQIRELGVNATEKDPGIWSALLEEDDYQTTECLREHCAPKTLETLDKLSYDIWVRVPGAIQMVQDLVGKGHFDKKVRGKGPKSGTVIRA